MPDPTEVPEQNTATPESDPNLANIINSAVKSQLTRQMKAMEEAFNARLAEALAAKPAVQAEEEKPSKGSKTDPEVAALRQQLEDMRKQSQAAAEAAQKAQQAQREDAAKNAIRQSLSAGGVKPELVDVAATYIWSKGSVTFDEQGTPLFKSKLERYGMVEDVDLPLADGIKNYLKGTEAAVFLPAPGSQGPTQKPRAASPLAGNQPTASSQYKLPEADASKADRAAFQAQLMKDLEGQF